MYQGAPTGQAEAPTGQITDRSGKESSTGEAEPWPKVKEERYSPPKEQEALRSVVQDLVH